jgi:hypothetical protein
MYTIHSFRRFAIRTAAVMALAASSLTPAFAADPSCDAKHSASHFPAPGSAEAVLYYKTPYLAHPTSSASPAINHFPEPGSAKAVRYYKTPYLMQPSVEARADDSEKHFPEPGSAEAVRYYKTPYLGTAGSITDSCK